MSFSGVDILTEFVEAARLGGARALTDMSRVMPAVERNRTRWLAAQHTWRSKPGNRERANARECERKRRLKKGTRP